MISMKYSAKEAKDESAEMMPSSASGPEYPWGLQIRLEKEELDKLGIKTLPGVNDEFHLMAICTVQSVSQNTTSRGKEDATVCLQITSMTVQSGEDAAMEKGESAATERKESSPAPSQSPARKRSPYLLGGNSSPGDGA